MWLHLPARYGALHLKKQKFMKQFRESHLFFNKWAFTTVADWKETVIEKSQKRALPDNHCTI